MIPYRLIILLVCLFFSITLTSQTYIGLKGGINQSKSTFLFNINPSDATNKGDLHGFYFGVPIEIVLNEYFNLIPELAFVSDGSVFSVQAREEQRVYNNTIFYTKIPLIAKLKILKYRQYEFGIIGGVIPAYALGVESSYFEGANFSQIYEEPLNFEEAGIRRFDIALSIGINTQKTIAKGWKILIDLRYNGGMFDIETHAPLTNTSENLQLTFGLLAPLTKTDEKLKLMDEI